MSSLSGETIDKLEIFTSGSKISGNKYKVIIDLNTSKNLYTMFQTFITVISNMDTDTGIRTSLVSKMLIIMYLHRENCLLTMRNADS